MTIDGAGTSTRKQKADRRREEILDLAIDMVTSGGASALSLRSLAERLGVTHVAVLHHFDSKEELLIQVLRRAEKRALGDALVLRLGQSTEDLMVEAWRAYEAAPALIELQSLLLQSVYTEDGLARAHTSLRNAQLRELLAVALRAEQATGAVRSDVDPDLMAAVLSASFDGLRQQWFLERSVPVEAALRELVRQLR